MLGCKSGRRSKFWCLLKCVWLFGRSVGRRERARGGRWRLLRQWHRRRRGRKGPREGSALDLLLFVGVLRALCASKSLCDHWWFVWPFVGCWTLRLGILLMACWCVVVAVAVLGITLSPAKLSVVVIAILLNISLVYQQGSTNVIHSLSLVTQQQRGERAHLWQPRLVFVFFVAVAADHLAAQLHSDLHHLWLHVRPLRLPPWLHNKKERKRKKEGRKEGIAVSTVTYERDRLPMWPAHTIPVEVVVHRMSICWSAVVVLIIMVGSAVLHFLPLLQSGESNSTHTCEQPGQGQRGEPKKKNENLCLVWIQRDVAELLLCFPFIHVVLLHELTQILGFVWLTINLWNNFQVVFQNAQNLWGGGHSAGLDHVMGMKYPFEGLIFVTNLALPFFRALFLLSDLEHATRVRITSHSYVFDRHIVCTTEQLELDFESNNNATTGLEENSF